MRGINQNKSQFELDVSDFAFRKIALTAQKSPPRIIPFMLKCIASTLSVMRKLLVSSACLLFRFTKRWPKEALCLSLGAMGLMLLYGLKPPTITEMAQTLPQQSPDKTVLTQWQMVTKPVQTFTLSAPEIERLPQNHQLWKHHTDALTEDRLTISRFQEGGLHAQLNVLRPKTAPEVLQNADPQVRNMFERSFYLTLVKASADQGLGLLRLGKTEMQSSKFGALESADALLSDGKTERSCLAYRHMNADLSLQFQGWLCADKQQMMTRPMLGCFIDRIGLLSAGGDKRLRRLFADAELKREPSCVQTRLAASTNQKGNWLDMSSNIPSLKTQTRN